LNEKALARVNQDYEQKLKKGAPFWRILGYHVYLYLIFVNHGKPIKRDNRVLFNGTDLRSFNGFMKRLTGSRVPHLRFFLVAPSFTSNAINSIPTAWSVDLYRRKNTLNLKKQSDLIYMNKLFTFAETELQLQLDLADDPRDVFGSRVRYCPFVIEEEDKEKDESWSKLKYRIQKIRSIFKFARASYLSKNRPEYHYELLYCHSRPKAVLYELNQIIVLLICLKDQKKLTAYGGLMDLPPELKPKEEK